MAVEKHTKVFFVHYVSVDKQIGSFRNFLSKHFMTIDFKLQLLSRLLLLLSFFGGTRIILEAF